MPYRAITDYLPPRWLRSGHANTVASYFLRRPAFQYQERVRIATPDDDFLDIDCFRQGSPTVALVLHGLEGSSGSVYAKGLARALAQQGWDVLAVNMRGCSGERNRHYHSYHSGKTDDLATVLAYAEASGRYRQACVVGFSLGGSIALRHWGEQGKALGSFAKACVGISVPCDLRTAAFRLSDWDNVLYRKNFMRDLKRKAREKLAHFPEQATFSEADLARVRSFADFDSLYTGPAHGYGDAEGYWRHGSCRPVLPHIAQPALLISAADDPFFGPACFPVEEAQRSRHFHFWHTPYGGHVGFVLPGFRGGWHEGAAIRFLKAFLE